MTKFTKEQLQQIIETDHVQCGDAAAMARQLLAGLEQEPVYQVCKEAGVWVDIEPGDVGSLKANGEQVREVYAAPQLPQPAVGDIDARMRAAGMLSAADILAGQPIDAFVRHLGVVDMDSLLNWAEMRRSEFLRMQASYELGDKEKDDLYEWVVSHVAVFGELHVNIRAAMLQGAEPVSQPYTLPADVIDALEKALQAMSFMGDTLNALDAVCEEDVEYVTPAFEAVREVLEGAEPVPGWIPCSERMPEFYFSVLATDEHEDMVIALPVYLDAGDRCAFQLSNGDIFIATHWMPLPAAPQQEADNG